MQSWKKNRVTINKQVISKMIPVHRSKRGSGATATLRHHLVALQRVVHLDRLALQPGHDEVQKHVQKHEVEEHNDSNEGLVLDESRDSARREIQRPGPLLDVGCKAPALRETAENLVTLNGNKVSLNVEVHWIDPLVLLLLDSLLSLLELPPHLVQLLLKGHLNGCLITRELLELGLLEVEQVRHFIQLVLHTVMILNVAILSPFWLLSVLLSRVFHFIELLFQLQYPLSVSIRLVPRICFHCFQVSHLLPQDQ
mmetsp:Transcript_13819/g.34811  ORF Transcript_13819/g.34811 Transcript_13819/m.34811 type:complete len:254 (-) Transcript_13819:1658-2419(-)